MIEALQNVFRIEELRRRILFTAAMLAVYRVGCIVVTPGINGNVIRQFFSQMEGTMFGLLNVFSGGAMEQKLADEVQGLADQQSKLLEMTEQIMDKMNDR